MSLILILLLKHVMDLVWVCVQKLVPMAVKENAKDVKEVARMVVKQHVVVDVVKVVKADAIQCAKVIV